MIFVNPELKCSRHLNNDWSLCECTQNWTIYTYIIGRLLHTHASWYCCEDWRLNKVVNFVFFAHINYSHSFIILRLNHWRHMDYFNDALTTFLGLKSVICCYVYTRYNLFAYSCCTSLFTLLFIKSTAYVLHILLFNLYLYLFSCVVLHILHCPLSGPGIHFTTDYILYNWVCDE